MNSDDGAKRRIEVSDGFRYCRVLTDSNGVTHFSDENLSFELADYAPPAAPISVSDIFGAENLSFISSPPGWVGDWHPAPRRQFVFVLTGVLEVEVSDGEVRLFESGSVVFVEDTTGKGHVSRVVGSERVTAATVPVVY